MDAGKTIGRGISFPPRIGQDGRMAWSAGERNVRESIRVILMTEERERLMSSDFGGGLASLIFSPNTVATRRAIEERISRALARWEPRITVDDVTVVEDPADAQAAIATITYRLVATQARERVTLGVGL